MNQFSILFGDQFTQARGERFLNRLGHKNADRFPSRRGNCFDNAPIESFWGSLASELVYQRRFATRDEAKRAISEYIEMFCAPEGSPLGG